MSTGPPDWEKTGNVTWVACPQKHWFPVAADLIVRGTVELICPHCDARFLPKDAAETIAP